MFLISKFMFDAVYEQEGLIRITPYAVDYHISNFYYFRLGALKQGGEVEEIADGKLTIEGNGFARIWSLERFELGQRILGMFGNSSSLVDKGLQLVHSPSVDPGFQGNLALGLRNNTKNDVSLDVGERIGKILFFDCADTFIDVEDFLENKLIEQDLKTREGVGADLFRLAGKVVQKEELRRKRSAQRKLEGDK